EHALEVSLRAATAGDRAALVARADQFVSQRALDASRHGLLEARGVIGPICGKFAAEGLLSAGRARADFSGGSEPRVHGRALPDGCAGGLGGGAGLGAVVLALCAVFAAARGGGAGFGDAVTFVLLHSAKL